MNGIGGAVLSGCARADDGAVSDTAGPDRHRNREADFGSYPSGSRHRGARHRTDSNHIPLATIVVTLLPHLLKSIFDQKRPDRLTIRGHLHGGPFSGKPLDAFPSGHAIHVGALASAATELPPAKRNLAWSIGAGLVLKRIVLLAHWTRDAITGLAIGAEVERLLRRWTGFGLWRRE